MVNWTIQSEDSWTEITVYVTKVIKLKKNRSERNAGRALSQTKTWVTRSKWYQNKYQPEPEKRVNLIDTLVKKC